MPDEMTGQRKRLIADGSVWEVAGPLPTLSVTGLPRIEIRCVEAGTRYEVGGVHPVTIYYWEGYNWSAATPEGGETRGS